DAKNAIYSPRIMGQLYERAGDHEKALYYYRKAAEAEAQHYKFPEEIYENLAKTFANLRSYDSANYYHKLARKQFRTGIYDLACIYMNQKRFDLAIPDLKEFLEIKRQQHDNNQVMFILENLGNCYQGLNQYASSFPYANELLELASRTGSRSFKQSGY